MSRYRLEWRVSQVSREWRTASTHWFLWRANRLMGRRVTDTGYAREWRIVDGSGRVLMEVVRLRLSNAPIRPNAAPPEPRSEP